jgi:hypothetical protein
MSTLFLKKFKKFFEEKNVKVNSGFPLDMSYVFLVCVFALSTCVIRDGMLMGHCKRRIM